MICERCILIIAFAITCFINLTITLNLSIGSIWVHRIVDLHDWVDKSFEC